MRAVAKAIGRSQFRRTGKCAVALVTMWVAGCDTGEVDTRDARAAAKSAPTKPVQVLTFPESIQVDDASVNAFVKEAMAACAKGAYDEFRLLWSSRQEPLQQDEFNAGWKAVLAINVRSLDLIRLAVKSDSGEEELREHYVFLAEVQFDPQHPAGRKEPTRQVVLLMGKEQGQWRLARAPAKVRSWVRDRVANADRDTDKSVVPISETPQGEPPAIHP